MLDRVSEKKQQKIFLVTFQMKNEIKFGVFMDGNKLWAGHLVNFGHVKNS